jgi:hypothetical protein
MTAQANGPPIKYKVEIPSFVKAQIKALAKAASSLGQKHAYCDAWLAIEKRLQTDPLQFGECRYHMAKGKLRCHIGVIWRRRASSS